MVNPWSFSVPMVRPICWMMTGAKPSVGSSSRSSRAPVRKIRAIASICCSPPDSLVPWLEPRRSLRLGNSAKMRSRSRPPGCTCGGSSRFSSTSRLAKMPRSSGQKAMPRRAMSLEARAISSMPLYRTEPLRLLTIPMMDFIVVVLPAPLRPSSVTTSPENTSKSTPCRMCDSPYQACRPPTVRSGAPRPGSAMADPQVGFLDGGIGRHRLVVAFRQDAAARQHRDAVGQVGDDAEIVLDHEHGAVGRHRLDQRRDAVDVLVAHAGGGLVEQHHGRVERQRGGDLERALASIGQLHRGPLGK